MCAEKNVIVISNLGGGGIFTAIAYFGVGHYQFGIQVCAFQTLEPLFSMGNAHEGLRQLNMKFSPNTFLPVI